MELHVFVLVIDLCFGQLHGAYEKQTSPTSDEMTSMFGLIFRAVHLRARVCEPRVPIPHDFVVEHVDYSTGVWLVLS